MVIDLPGKRQFFFFRRKNLKSEKIKLTEEGKNLSDNAKLCLIFNNYLSEIIAICKIPSLIDNNACNSNTIRNLLLTI